MMAQDPPVDAAVLHVGGSAWSTMLERSSNWPTFEMVMQDSVPDPADRQLLYSVSQLFWDPADPLLYASDWPTCEAAADYASVFEIASAFIDSKNASAAPKFWSRNAQAAYRLTDVPSAD